MKKKLMFLSAIMGAVIVLSGCGQKPQDQTATNTDKEDKAIENKADSGSSKNDSGSQENTSLKDLMAMGKNLECTWSATDDKGKTSTGKVDISGQKFKMTVTVDSPDGSGKSNFYTLNDGTWVYSWGDMMKGTGMKIKTADAQQMGKDLQSNSSQGAPGQGQSQDWQKNYDYNCDPWQASDSTFAVPTDVNFMDTGSLLKGIKGAPQGLPQGAPAMPNIQQ